MKRMMWTMMALAAAAIMLPAFADNSELEALKARIAALEAQQVETHENVSRLVRSEVAALQDELGYAAMADAGVVSLCKADALKIGGDLRLRWEVNEDDSNSSAKALRGNFNTEGNLRDTRERFRYRFRLGMNWKNEDWELGFRLATASAANNTRNSNMVGTGVTGTYAIGIDLMYAKHMWEMEDAELALVLGKMPMPFKSSYMFWDSDITPEGVAVTAEMGMLYGAAGVIVIQDNAAYDQADNVMYGIQLGVKDELDNLNYDVAAGLYYYNSPTTNADASTAAASGFSPQNKDYDFLVGQLYGQVGTEMQEVGLDLFGEIFQNFGADGPAGSGQVGGILGAGAEKPADNDLGFVIGAKADWRKFTAMLAYGHVEADSQVAGFADSDFGMNAKGVEFTLDYAAMKNMTIGLDLIQVSEIEGFDVDARTI